MVINAPIRVYTLILLGLLQLSGCTIVSKYAEEEGKEALMIVRNSAIVGRRVAVAEIKNSITYNSRERRWENIVMDNEQIPPNMQLEKEYCDELT